MKEMLDDLKDLSGVNGACLFHTRNGVIESNLPAIFTQEKLAEIAKWLIKLLGAGRMSFSDLTDLVLQYDESAILARQINNTMIIFLMCDPGFNQNLVTMSLNLLQQEMQNAAFPATGTVTQETFAAPSPSRIDYKVSQILEQIKKQLSQILGPMAGLIYDDVLESWQDQGKHSLNDLPVFIELLEKEVENDEQIKRLRKLITPIIAQAGVNNHVHS